MFLTATLFQCQLYFIFSIRYLLSIYALLLCAKYFSRYLGKAVNFSQSSHTHRAYLQIDLIIRTYKTISPLTTVNFRLPRPVLTKISVLQLHSKELSQFNKLLLAHQSLLKRKLLTFSSQLPFPPLTLHVHCSHLPLPHTHRTYPPEE